MSKKLKIRKNEGVPRHFKSVQVTKDNIGEVATWMGSAHYEINYDNAKNPRSVKFYIQNESPVSTMVGGYVVKIVKPLPEYSTSRFFGVHAAAFKEEYRDGWS